MVVVVVVAAAAVAVVIVVVAVGDQNQLGDIHCRTTVITDWSINICCC